MGYEYARADIKHWVFRVLLCLLCAGTTAGIQALEVPGLSGRVVDNADLLSEASRIEITSQLQALEQSHGAQVALLTVPGLEGEVLEDYSLRVAESWKLGRKEADDGLLLLVAREDRKIRIEVGYGLEGVITDLDARRIIDNIMVPAFRNNNYEAGIQAAVTAISAKIQGDASAIPEHVVSQGPPKGTAMVVGFFLLFILPFAWLSVAIKGSSGWTSYWMVAPFSFVIPLIYSPGLALIWLAAWLITIPILRMVWPEKWKIEAGTGGGSSSWSSSSSSGGGGFSGGGGSFGGGGASGSW